MRSVKSGKLNPVLVLQGATAVSFLEAFGTVLIGITLIVSGLQGYLMGVGRLGDRVAGWLTRVSLIIGGIAIGLPWITATIIGLVLTVPVILGYLLVNWRAKRAASASAPG